MGALSSPLSPSTPYPTEYYGELTQPLCSFISIYELVGAFHDFVLALEFIEKEGKAHRGIGLRNLLLQPRNGTYDNAQENLTEAANLLDNMDVTHEDLVKLRDLLCCSKGVLIDFNDAVSNIITSPSDRLTPFHCNNTAPFMAIELLIFGAQHRVAHDLESLYYVFLVICTGFASPGILRKEGGVYCEGDGSANISSWFHGGSNEGLYTNTFKYLGFDKLGRLLSGFWPEVIEQTAEYFTPLRDCFQTLHDVLFRRVFDYAYSERERLAPDTTCEQFLNVLRPLLYNHELIMEHMSALKARKDNLATSEAQTMKGTKRRAASFTRADDLDFVATDKRMRINV